MASPEEPRIKGVGKYLEINESHQALQHSFANETMWCWYGNDWAKRNTAEWTCPWWSNVFQKPKTSQTEGYAFFLFFFFFLFHSGKLLSAVLSFHVATGPDKSKELKSEEHFQGKTFLSLPEWICRGLGSTDQALSYRKPLLYWPPESSVYITKGCWSIQFLIWKISITCQNPSEV